MKRLLLYTAIWILLPRISEATEPIIDTSAYDTFWPVVEILQRDLEPTTEIWDEMLTTVGYQTLFKVEFTPIDFQRRMRVALKPSMAEERGRTLRNAELGPLVQHLINVVARREELDREVARLQAPNVLREHLDGMYALLPGDLTDEVPVIAVTVFANNGRGTDPLIIDPLAIATWDVPPYLAHELHHWYRNKIMDFELNRVRPADLLIVRALDAMQSEGIADFIDKQIWIESPLQTPVSRRQYAELYRRELEDSALLIEALDDALIAWSEATTREDKIAAGRNFVQALPLAGHPTGYHAARIILGAFGSAKIKETIGDPFAFFLAYDTAARKSGHARSLSDPARDALELLQSEYVETARR